MRRAGTPLIALAVALLAAAATTGPARAQPPSGIVRPSSEAGLTPQQLGAQLFAGNCASCHGGAGEGVPLPTAANGAGNIRGAGPPLIGVGQQAADFYLRTGYMPLAAADQQPTRRPVRFSEPELQVLIQYVGSLGPGPSIPAPHPTTTQVGRGFTLFTEHCAGCHQAVAEGGVVTGARVPALKQATPTQIAEAVRIGPYLMPRFSRTAISDSDLDAIIAYVQAVKRPDDAGGWGIGHIGPVPEGMVTWLIAGTVLVAVCVVIGRRYRA